MLRIRFGAKDRDRMGLPEVVEFDSDELRLRELRDMDQQLNGLTYAELNKRVDDDDPHTMLLARGQLYWLAVRRHGVDVSWADFDCDMNAVEIEPDPNLPAPDGAQ